MKSILFIVFLIAVVSANLVEKNSKLSHDIEDCHVTSDPATKKWTIFHTETVEARGHFLQIVERELKWPTSGVTTDEITCIRVTDNYGDGTGGYPTILTGGVGQNFVTIKMVSQRSRGFSFNVQIHGKPEVEKSKMI